MLIWGRVPNCAGLDSGHNAARVADTSIRRRSSPPDRTHPSPFLSGTSKMAFSASPGRSRWTMFLLAAALTLLVLTSRACAQAPDAAPAAAEEGSNMVVFLIGSLGWIFAPLLFAV